MPEQPTFAPKMKIRTPTPSGLNTDASSWPSESGCGSDPYREICDELYALLTRKRGYYGCGEDPLENALGVAEDGIDPVAYQVARVGEKTRRMRGPLGTIDRQKTMLDIAGHAVVAVACERRLKRD